jgi:hypothetical protein
MAEELIRPKWLRILLGIFTAWISFMISLATFLVIVLIIQVEIFDLELSGTPALIIVLAELIISIFISSRITRWQNNFLDKKSLRFNYILLMILIILTFIAMPAPFIYTIF